MRYVLDTNVLIAAYRQYYGPDICPGFWDFMENKISRGELVIIDRVRAEIKKPPKLVAWVDRTSGGIFTSTRTNHIMLHYKNFINWVYNSRKFKPAAKVEFASVADGWLVAYAMAEGITVVTNEVYDRKIRKKVKIPNVCKRYSIPYMNTYEMLRTLKASFKW